MMYHLVNGHDKIRIVSLGGPVIWITPHEAEKTITFVVPIRI